MSSRKRSGSGSKRPKEKVVYIYELLFRGEDPAKTNTEFWNEFFLLQPNVDSLEGEFSKLTNEQLIAVKDNINLMFTQCIDMLDSGKIESYLTIVSGVQYDVLLFSEHPKRVTNCLQTLCALFYAIFKKQATDVGFDVINTIFDFQEVEDKMKHLISQCNNLLISI